MQRRGQQQACDRVAGARDSDGEATSLVEPAGEEGGGRNAPQQAGAETHEAGKDPELTERLHRGLSQQGQSEQHSTCAENPAGPAPVDELPRQRHPDHHRQTHP